MVIDSSVWIEILRRGPLHVECEKAMHRKSIAVPTLVLFEVYRKIKEKVSEEVALEAVAVLSQNQILELTREVSILAGDLSLEYGLAMADAIVLAHAKELGAPLLTLDNDFRGLPGADVIE